MSALMIQLRAVRTLKHTRKNPRVQQVLAAREAELLSLIFFGD